MVCRGVYVTQHKLTCLLRCCGAKVLSLFLLLLLHLILKFLIWFCYSTVISLLRVLCGGIFLACHIINGVERVEIVLRFLSWGSAKIYLYYYAVHILVKYLNCYLLGCYTIVGEVILGRPCHLRFVNKSFSKN